MDTQSTHPKTDPKNLKGEPGDVDSSSARAEQWPPTGPELTERQMNRVIGSQTARIARALDTTVDLVVDGQSSLADIVARLVREHRIAVLLNEKSFEQQGIAIHHVPAFEVHGVTLMSALKSLLDELLKPRNVSSIIKVRSGVLSLAAQSPWDVLDEAFLDA